MSFLLKKQKNGPPLGFKNLATTWTGLHFVTTTLMTLFLRWLGYIHPSHLPTSELMMFVLFSNFSIVGMNVSLMWNLVGFYQVHSSKLVIMYITLHSNWMNSEYCDLFVKSQTAKLSMIPISCLFELHLTRFDIRMTQS
uniref:Uncharacterized protein n=1 Tax=Lactuca sativa TaxID=4236 RepID=A0A9R1W0W0_LACSA|nr:hypothetical protein LSAT_V11C400202350 [Lactuca sativa]